MEDRGLNFLATEMQSERQGFFVYVEWDGTASDGEKFSTMLDWIREHYYEYRTLPSRNGPRCYMYVCKTVGPRADGAIFIFKTLVAATHFKLRFVG